MTVRVRDIMTPDPLTVDVEARLSEAALVMDGQHIQHLVVTREGVAVGILSAQDLHDAEPSVNIVRDASERRSFLGRVRVVDVATMNPETVLADTPVLDAIQILRRLRVGSLPVKDQGRLVGIVTSGDLITLLERILRDQAGEAR